VRSDFGMPWNVLGKYASFRTYARGRHTGHSSGVLATDRLAKEALDRAKCTIRSHASFMIKGAT